MRHHHDPHGKKPFEFDEKEKEHLDSMAARDKEVGDDEYDDELAEEDTPARIDETRFGSIQ